MLGLIALFLISAWTPATAEPFRFHVSQEPGHLDPKALQDSSGGFFYYNLFRSLYRLDENLKPVPDLATCSFSGLSGECRIGKNAKFSDESPILAEHFIFAFRRLLTAPAARNVDLLFSVKNTKKILKGTLAPKDLGVHSPAPDILRIDLEYEDPEIFYKLASPVLAPLKGEPPKDKKEFAKSPVTGPYKIQSWPAAGPIVLVPNLNYGSQAKKRPVVEVLLVDQDSTARQLYDLGKLSFLKRVTTNEIPALKGRKDFLFRPMLRFDYIGFGPSLAELPELRKALALSLKFADMQKLYHTPGIIGCPSLPESFFVKRPCLQMDLPKARAAAEKFDRDKIPKLELLYPALLGSDADNGMVWLQAQWKKHLDLPVELHQREFGLFTKALQQSPPPLFRKGFNLDRPTCSAAVEIFTTGHPDNFIHLKSPEFDDLVGRLRRSTGKQQKQLCDKSVRFLLDRYLIIPLGELYFPMLASQDFSGWRHTPFNQLDLTELRYRPKSRPIKARKGNADKS